MKRINILIVLMFITSCSSLSKNMVQTGELRIHEGVHEKSKWSKNLTFKRYSYYKELTLLLDALVYKVDSKSPFYDWFSKVEKKEIKSCDEFLVTLYYTADSSRLSRGMYFQELKRNGFRSTSLNGFFSHLKMHPDYERLSLGSYKISGLCRRKSQGNITLNFPGFKSISI